MQIKIVGANRTELHVNDGLVVFFSYETPVAAHVAGEGYYRTSKRWSVTTSKHITQWLDGAKAQERDQEHFDTLLNNTRI